MFSQIKLWTFGHTFRSVSREAVVHHTFDRVPNGCSHDFKFTETCSNFCTILYHASSIEYTLTFRPAASPYLVLRALENGHVGPAKLGVTRYCKAFVHLKSLHCLLTLYI